VSWDISIQKFAKVYRSISEIPDDAELLALGSRAAVHFAISEVFSNVDWSDPEWGRYESDIGSIEFNNGGTEPLMGFMMHVRAGAEIVPLIVTLCQSQGWSALDCSTGELLEHSAEPEAGVKAWQSYRDQVIRSDGAQ
jgi:hypothetical protein